MLVDAKINLSEEDKQDIEYILTGLNTTMQYIREPIPVETSLEHIDGYYTGIMEVFKDLKIREHFFRKRISEQYNIPYVFDYRNGSIFINQEE